MVREITNAKLITAILPQGKASGVQRALVEERGIESVNHHGARGVGRFSPLTARGIGEQQPKEIIEVVCPAEDADEIMEFMFFKGDMNHPHGGIIYMCELPRATLMEMPDLPREE